MLYELPGHRPPLTLVGPHDTTFWAALGMEPADRHALVIGAASAPATATVIVGTLLDLARYLDPFTGFPTTIAALAAQARAGLSADEAQALRPEPPAPQRPAPVDPGTDLITLPHSGIRVPNDPVPGVALPGAAHRRRGGVHRHPQARQDHRRPETLALAARPTSSRPTSRTGS